MNPILKQIALFLKLIRVKQWVKNFFIFTPPLFALQLEVIWLNGAVISTFLAFSLAASAIYVYNDWRDYEKDKLHPKKSSRPIASGQVSVAVALAVSIALMCAALLYSYTINAKILLIIAVYIAINFFYSNGLKKIPILDVLIIAFGFVLRVLAGGVSANIAVSKWYVLMIFLLALVLALGKRRDDILIGGQIEGNIRDSISGYTIEFINYAVLLLSVISIVCYIMYTTALDVIEKVGSDMLYITVFPVIAGFLRYLQLLFVYNKTGTPTDLFTKDKAIQLCIALWVVLFAMIRLYPDLTF